MSFSSVAEYSRTPIDTNPKETAPFQIARIAVPPPPPPAPPIRPQWTVHGTVPARAAPAALSRLWRSCCSRRVRRTPIRRYRTYVLTLAVRVAGVRHDRLLTKSAVTGTEFMCWLTHGSRCRRAFCQGGDHDVPVD